MVSHNILGPIKKNKKMSQLVSVNIIYLNLFNQIKNIQKIIK